MSSRVMKLASVYEGWTVLRVATIQLADGQSIHREIEDHGVAVAVLPYDPRRRVALLVRLMRAPMLIATGEETSLEAPAGLNEDVDAPTCARREVLEECGLRIGTLEPVVNASAVAYAAKPLPKRKKVLPSTDGIKTGMPT